MQKYVDKNKNHFLLFLYISEYIFYLHKICKIFLSVPQLFVCEVNTYSAKVET